MATNFDEQIKNHPLYALATEVGGYHLRTTLKSQKAFDIELANMMKALEKQKEKLTPEQKEIYQKALEDMKKPKKQASEQSKAQEQKAPEAQENNTPLTESNKDKGEDKMADINYQEELEKKDLYKLAGALGIDMKYSPKNKDELDNALADIKEVIKKRQADEKQKAEDMKKLEDKPELKKEYERIEEENKPRQTLEVEQKEEQAEAPANNLDWVEAKKKFWAEFAAKNALAADLTPPEGDNAKVYCKLSKDDKQEGVVSYSSPNSARVSKDSGFKIYQGLVEDAVKNELSITFGKSLDDKQKLMLYAAVLASGAKYQSGEKVQAVNPPVLTDDLMKSKLFEELPQEAKDALKAKYVGDRVAKLREVVKNPEAHLSPEELAKRKAKQLDRDKIMAARLGIIPEYKTKTLAGKERIVQQDEALIKDGNLNEARVSKEQFDALVARKKELEGK